MDNMYTGKSSKNPNKPLIGGLLLGIGFIAFAVYLYIDLAAWETSTEEKRMNAILWALYDLGGKWLVSGVFSLLGLFMIWNGAKKTKELKRIKNGAHQ